MVLVTNKYRLVRWVVKEGSVEGLHRRAEPLAEDLPLHAAERTQVLGYGIERLSDGLVCPFERLQTAKEMIDNEGLGLLNPHLTFLRVTKGIYITPVDNEGKDLPFIYEEEQCEDKSDCSLGAVFIALILWVFIFVFVFIFTIG